MTPRDALLAKIGAQFAQDPAPPPVVSLDEYFGGNHDKECIAPNQVGDGRPSLADFYAHFRRIQERPDVQAVLVGIHGDWVDCEKRPEQWPPAENIHIYTSAAVDEVEQWIAGTAADGAGEGWPYGRHPAAPALAPGHRVVTVYWD